MGLSGGFSNLGLTRVEMPLGCWIFDSQIHKSGRAKDTLVLKALGKISECRQLREEVRGLSPEEANVKGLGDKERLVGQGKPRQQVT